MIRKEKFEKFLESLKGTGNDALIEGIMNGFQACVEADMINFPIPSSYWEVDGDDDDVSLFEELKEMYKLPTRGLDANFSCEVMQIDDGNYGYEKTFYIVDDEIDGDVAYCMINDDDDEGWEPIKDIFTASTVQEFEVKIYERYKELKQTNVDVPNAINFAHAREIKGIEKNILPHVG